MYRRPADLDLAIAQKYAHAFEALFAANVVARMAARDLGEKGARAGAAMVAAQFAELRRLERLEPRVRLILVRPAQSRASIARKLLNGRTRQQELAAFLTGLQSEPVEELDSLRVLSAETEPERAPPQLESLLVTTPSNAPPPSERRELYFRRVEEGVNKAA